MPSSTSVSERAKALSAETNWSLLLVVFGLSAVLQVVIASRSGLWADEIYSLAYATGHSLEHPAATADPQRGDFVEPNHPMPHTATENDSSLRPMICWAHFFR